MKRMRPICSHRNPTSLVNKGFIIVIEKEHFFGEELIDFGLHIV